MSPARMRPVTDRAGAGRSWPAWAVLALSIGLWATAVGLGRAHGPLTGVPVFDIVDVVTYSAFLAWTAVGGVIVGRRPGNRIGWLLCATGLLMLLGAGATSTPWRRCWVAGRRCPAAGPRRGSPPGRPCSA